MPTTAMTLIAKQTISADGVLSVTISNIPQNFKDLVVRSSARFATASSGGWQDVLTTFNDTSTGYNETLIWGNGDSAGTGANTVQSPDKTNIAWAHFATTGTAPANTFSNAEFYISNYSSSSSFKTLSGVTITEKQATGPGSSINSKTAAVWENNAPITSITFSITSEGFARGSSFYVYGLSDSPSQINLNIPYALGGDIITNDGTYWYHGFLFSGAFKPLNNLNADVLVIAGGGAGSGTGGGGAGGFRTATSQILTPSSPVTATVGAGGPSSTTSGGDSSFGSFTATGGGKGRNNTNSTGSNGGSGGGGSDGGAGAAGNAGGYSPVEGYAGGASSNTNAGGGGGGAGAVGGAGNSGGVGGVGGVGTYTTLTNAMGAATSTGVLSGGNYYYAGGGGGGSNVGNTPGGTGGGGQGMNNGTIASYGRNGTGSGGGGLYSSGSSQGGSGLIIVRYPMV